MVTWDQIEGQWHRVCWQHVKAPLKANWERLTDDDILSVAGNKDRLFDKLQQRYGMLREDARAQVDAWLAKLLPSEVV
jgi:uncharacterized protein YjbJ (UPF0337 family)